MAVSLRLLAVLLLAATWCDAAETDANLPEMRRTFLQAEKYIDSGDDAAFFSLAQTLETYPLYPYLQYEWLKNHLDDATAIQRFLSSYNSSRYARLLRGKWLAQLGKTRQWPLFIQYYRSTDNQELQCYFAMAQSENGQQAAALANARQFWLNGKTLPESCQDLLALLKAAPEFNADLIWRRFQAALRQDNQALANEMQGLLPEPQKTAAGLWLKLLRQPELLKEAADWKQQYAEAGALFAFTVARWANKAPASALAIWEAEKANYAIPAAEQAETDRQLALNLAFKRDRRAYDKLQQLSHQDNATREWRVRAALSQQNWLQADTALNELPDAELQQEKWQYWQARARAGLGEPAAAEEIYRQLAKNRSYYGLLATTHLQQRLNMNDHPLSIDPAETQALQQGREFQVAAELLALDRKAEARRQWSYATAGLQPHELLAAAKLAELWRWPAMTIATLGKAEAWDDVGLRFPLAQADIIQQNAQAAQLDPAVLFGLIRQETAFDESAESPVGAKGLMQLMPATARQIAEELHENWLGDASLFEPALNVRYGGIYFKKLLLQFNGNYMLSAAAYNAGPNRVKQWRPQAGPLPGDIWIETIPYKETRNYVASVLLYTLIYQQRLQRTSLNPQEMVLEVKPEG